MNFKYISGMLTALTLLIIISCSENQKKEERAKEYTLVWADEFDYTGKPNPSKWSYELGFIRASEKQYYTDSLNNARVENGNLIIEAHKEQIKNETPPFFERPAYVDNIKFADYTSASVTTRSIKDWKYTKIEIRAKLPKGRGTWPAFWMLGRNWGTVPFIPKPIIMY